MKTYVVYERKSGKIVHTHTTPLEGQQEPERILRLVHASHDRAQLATLEVSVGEVQQGEAYHVNPKTSKLEKAKGGASALAGGRRR